MSHPLVGQVTNVTARKDSGTGKSIIKKFLSGNDEQSCGVSERGQAGFFGRLYERKQKEITEMKEIKESS